MPMDIDELDWSDPSDPQGTKEDIKEPIKTEEVVEHASEGEKQEVEEPPTEKDNIETPPATETDDQIIIDLLKRQGISDPTKINFQEEDGNIKKTDWKDLSTEEKLNILSNQDVIEKNEDEEMDDDEIDLINNIRSKGISPKEYLDSIKQQVAEEYAQNNQSQQAEHYKIDDYNDDELFVLDLKSRIPDITDEELAHSLETAKQDENLYSKQMNGIRQEYKNLEDNQNIMIEEETKANQQAEQQEKWNEFSNTIINNIDKFNDNDTMFELDDADKQDIANFILGHDQAGVSYISQALDDPDTLVKMAWFALKGKDALDSVTEYYNKQITEVGKTNYKKGLEEGKKQNSSKAKVVVNNGNGSKFNVRGNSTKTIEELDF